MAQHDHHDVDAPGNQPARPDWAALYQRHRETMLRVAASLLRQASRDTDQAQDIVNQVFVEVMNNPPDPPGNWEAYLVRATANRTKDYMMTAEARRAVPAGTGARGDGPVLLDRPADDDVEEQALRAVRTEQLRHRVREVLAACDRCSDDLFGAEYRTASRRLLARAAPGLPALRTTCSTG